jgi:phage shock protein C
VPRKLVRDTRHGLVGGVAAGFGDYLEVDPVLVRLALILLVFANGIGLLVYLVAWALIPRAPEAAGQDTASGAEALRDASVRLAEQVRSRAGVEQVQAAVGGLLVLLGGLLLAHNLGWLYWPRWASIETLWPVLLIALGIGLVTKSRRAPARS